MAKEKEAKKEVKEAKKDINPANGKSLNVMGITKNPKYGGV